MDKAETTETTHDVNDSSCLMVRSADDISHARILEKSSHHDGAIYKGNWGNYYEIDFADRNGTRTEIKELSVAQDCYPDQENCTSHMPSQMLYGYMAVRDDVDGKLNYVFNRTRDDPVIVQQGSLIEMTGPKRGIIILSDILFEFDTRIKNGEREEDDLQLVDGLIHCDYRMWWLPFTSRINGNCGTVDMCLLKLEFEAKVEVLISEVQSAFDLSLSSFVSITDVRKEFQLFRGTVDESCVKRFASAIPMDTMMHLKSKVGQKGCDRDTVHYCSFSARLHGCVNRRVKLEVACISVTVTWSPPLF